MKMPPGMISCVIIVPTEDVEQHSQRTSCQTEALRTSEPKASFCSSSSTSSSIGGNYNTMTERLARRLESIGKTQRQMGEILYDPCSSAILIDSASTGSTSDEQTLKPLNSQKNCLVVGDKVKDNSRHKRSVKLEADRYAALESVLREIIFKLSIKNVFWSKDIGEQMLQARFSIYMDEKYERLIATLHEWGIGEREGTSVSLVNCLDSKISAHQYEVHESHSLESGWERFMDSVRCRLNVNHVVRQVRQDAIVTLDYLVLLVAASVLACFGLVDNSNLFLFSSMLISPLMGPIIAGIFGTVIKDRKLIWLGLKNELLGTACATVVGLIFGLIICCWGQVFIISEGLTQEILSRCEIHSLFIGFFTALASGAAGAIGVLGGNTGSLIGVAISASLLPPAVNSGILSALALCLYLVRPQNTILGNLIKNKYYSADPCVELTVYALISMSLTFLNIVCVWFMGVLVLRFKEIAPSTNTPNEKFWKHDIKVARNATYDIATQKAINDFEADQNGNENLAMNDAQYHQTWSPSNNFKEFESTCRRSNYHTVQGFEKLCQALQRKKNPTQSCTESSTQSMNVMQLFEQGPIQTSQPQSLVPSEKPINVNLKADAIKRTPIDSNAQHLQNKLLAKAENGDISKIQQRRVNFNVTPSDICLIDESQGHGIGPFPKPIFTIEQDCNPVVKPNQEANYKKLDAIVVHSNEAPVLKLQTETKAESSSPSKSGTNYSDDEFEA